jgi:hypothetical protein
MGSSGTFLPEKVFIGGVDVTSAQPVTTSVIALAAAAALGAASAAMAASSHGSGGGGGGSGGSGGRGAAISGGGGSGAGFATSQGSVSSPGRASTFSSQGNLGPNTTMGPGKTWSGKTSAWNGPHNRHHHHFRNRSEFFAFGFAGDYGYYDSCWQWVPTNWGLQRVWVCDYPYPY